MALGLSVLGPKEDAALAALKSNVTEPGLYFFSGHGHDEEADRRGRRCMDGKI